MELSRTAAPCRLGVEMWVLCSLAARRPCASKKSRNTARSLAVQLIHEPKVNKRP